MKHIYLALLRLYPREYRVTFRAEMLSAFEEAAQDRRKDGIGVSIGFVLAEIWGLAVGIAPEWRAKFAQSDGYLAIRNRTEQKTDQPAEVMEIERQIESALKCMEHAIATHQFTKARFYSEAEHRLRAKLRRLETGSI